jgi:hypothetical protein
LRGTLSVTGCAAIAVFAGETKSVNAPREQPVML